MCARSITLPRIFEPNLPSVHFATSSITSSDGSTNSYSCFGASTCFASSLCKSSTGRTFSTAQCIASIIVSSGTSFAPASTITTFPSLHATTKSSGEISRSSGDKNPLNSPPIRPIRIPATGPSNGTPAFINAAEAAIIATQSGRNVGSIDNTVQTTCTS